MAVDVHSWSSYFEEIIRLLEDSNRQYGVANLSYTHYVLERLEICLQTSSATNNTSQYHRKIAVVYIETRLTK